MSPRLGPPNPEGGPHARRQPPDRTARRDPARRDMDRPGLDEPEPPPQPPRAWCLFRCGRATLAVGLEAVAEVVEVERLVVLPHSPPRVLGLCALRREVIPVIGLVDPGDEPAGPGP